MTEMIPPEHGEREGPPPMPRCPECATVIDTYLAAGAGDGKGRCPEHGLVTATYGDREAIRLRRCVMRIPDPPHSVKVPQLAREPFDPKLDYPERYTDGPI